MSRALEIVTLSADQVREMIGEAVARALDECRRRELADCQGLSLNGAAKMARTRRDTVLAALETGALKGIRRGTRWSVTAASVKSWLEAGRPAAP